MDEINLYDWAAYKFGYEHRLVGYVPISENTYRCIISEPIINVFKDKGMVETADQKQYTLLDPIKTEQKIDMMYALDRWLNLNNKGPGQDVTHVLMESLGR